MKRLFTLLLTLAMGVNVQAQTTKQVAQTKMDELRALIKVANKKKINTLREQTALRTAEIFMGYADWDEQNIETNVKHFGLVARYQDEKEKYAELLPDFQRNEIIEMMDSSMTELQAVIKGQIKRLDTPDVDWAKIKVEGDQIIYNGKAVFLVDWVWKPDTKLYNEFHGGQDGFFLTPNYVTNEKGSIAPYIKKQLEEKPTGRAGFIFFNHTSTPKWAVTKDPTIKDGPGIKYTMYDINNPIAREVQSALIAGTVPLTAGKNYSKLGYMLCNEPHWNTIEDTWSSAPLSEKAFEQFKVWLKQRHGDIQTLNALWKTSFSSFDAIDVPRIMTDEQQGTPLYFDYMSFNQDRVTDWFVFLRDEVKRYDPAALTHIKVMPDLWSNGKRDHGLDMEALTRNSEIIGNDAGSCEKWMWGKPHHWEKNYVMDWVELCMAQDFYKSVSPDKIMFNSEAHFLSTGKSRDLYQTPKYARCNYWLATIHGMTTSQTWYWCRREDGSSRENSDSSGYAGSNNHQPRIVNEVHSTMLDLNSVSEQIMSFQRQSKSIRLFYTKASSIGDIGYMSDVFSIYESVAFCGVPVGFATEGIIKNNSNDWEVITIYKTPRVFESDVAALQSYLDKGGVVVMDRASMLTDEYDRPLKTQLKSSKGELIVVDNLAQMSDLAIERVYKSKSSPALRVSESSDRTQKGVIWRVIDGEKGAKIINITNLGKSDATVDISLSNGAKISSVKNVLTGESVEFPRVMQPYDLYMLEIK